MAKCETKYWGKLDFAEDSVIEFPTGIPGFELERQFILIEQRPLDPLVFLQSLSTPALCFVAVHARVLVPEYQLRISAENLEALGLPETFQPSVGPDLACLSLIHIDKDEVTANLLAPVVIHVPSRRGMQAIQTGCDYSHRHRVDLVEDPVCS